MNNSTASSATAKQLHQKPKRNMHTYTERTRTTQNPRKKKCTYTELVQQSLQQIREEKQARNARKARRARACALDVCACARACAHWVALEEGTGVRGGVGES
jgi:hypothetical protein